MFVPKSALAIVSHCDAESSRYALGAVQFERDTDGKAIAVATDGRRLAMLKWDEPEVKTPACDQTKLVESIGLDVAPVEKFTSLLPMADVKRAAKMVSAKNAVQARQPVTAHVLVEESSANGTVKLGAHSGESASSMTVNSQEGRFPKWRDVFPKDCQTVSIKLDPRYLAEACKLLEDFAGTADNRGVTITLHQSIDYRSGADRWDEKPVVISAQNCEGRSGQVVIMPLASDQ